MLTVFTNIVTAIERWSLQKKVTCLTTDSAAVMLKAAELASLPHMPCVAHILHNSVTHALEEQGSLNELVKKCHDLAKFFHSKPKMMQALEEEQRKKTPGKDPLIVFMDVKTRWNSTLAMMERLFSLRSAMTGVYMTLVSSNYETENKETLESLNLKENEWSRVKNIIDILKIFSDATLIFSSANPQGLAAMVVPWISNISMSLDNHLASESQDLTDFRTALRAQLKKRMNASDILLKASFFHPSFNRLYRTIDRSRFTQVQTILRLEFDSYVPAMHRSRESRDAPMAVASNVNLERLMAMQDDTPGDNLDSTAPNEFDRYFKQRQCQVASVDPLQWWSENRASFPILSGLAKKYLVVLAISVRSERLFSVASNYVTDKRNRLLDTCVSDLVVSNELSRCLKSLMVKETPKS